MSSVDDIEQFLYANIPLSTAIGLKIKQATSDSVELYAPLEPNMNDKRTAFSGSIASTLFLSGWVLTRLLVQAGGMNLSDYDVVIANSDIKFQAPITGDFRAVTTPAMQKDAAATFQQRLATTGKSKLEIQGTAFSEDRTCCLFTGVYVAFRKPITSQKL